MKGTVHRKVKRTWLSYNRCEIVIPMLCKHKLSSIEVGGQRREVGRGLGCRCKGRPQRQTAHSRHCSPKTQNPIPNPLSYLESLYSQENLPTAKIIELPTPNLHSTQPTPWHQLVLLMLFNCSSCLCWMENLQVLAFQRIGSPQAPRRWQSKGESAFASSHPKWISLGPLPLGTCKWLGNALWAPVVSKASSKEGPRLCPPALPAAQPSVSKSNRAHVNNFLPRSSVRVFFFSFWDRRPTGQHQSTGGNSPPSKFSVK